MSTFYFFIFQEEMSSIFSELNKDGSRGIDEAEFKDFFYGHMLKWRPDVRLAQGMFNQLKEPRRLFDNPHQAEGVTLSKLQAFLEKKQGVQVSLEEVEKMVEKQKKKNKFVNVSTIEYSYVKI